MLSVASNRYTPFYYDEAPSNDPFRSLPPSSPFTSYWQQQQERRPIIGANCYKHRNYYAIMAAQQQAAQIASSSTPSAGLYGTRPMDGSIPTTSTCYIAEQPQPQHRHQLLQQPSAIGQSPAAMRVLRSSAQPQPLMQPPRTMLPSSSTVGAVTPQLVTTAAAAPARRNIGNNDEEEGVDCSPCFGNDTFRRTFRIVVLGQILSLCLCGTGVTSQLLTDHNVNTPAAQSFLNYFFLCSFYGTILVFKTGDNSLLPVIRKRGWKYFVLSLIDVEANYFIVYAYQFTNLTSIQLLDCSTIPMVLLLSWLFLSVRYLLTHIVGVCICLVGIAILIWADVLEGKGIPGGSNRLLGDIFCVIGSLLYATGNVGEEFFIKQTSRTEYLGMIGLFGSIISGIQLAALEHNELARVRWSGAIIGLYLLFAASMFVFYSLVAVVMQKASALMFNLSILTADFYTLLFGLFFFKYEFHALYFVSFAVVVSGSILYSLRPTQRRDSEEPRRVCPCCFWCLYWCCGCCCCNSCFEQNGSSRGSLDVTPMPPASAGSTLPNSTSPIPLELAMYMQRFGGGVPGAGVGLAGGAVHYCPVHGASTATCSPSLNPTQLSAETRS